MTGRWMPESIARLSDAHTCPVCELTPLRDGCCPRCGADLRGPQGLELWNASLAAVAALNTRAALVARVPRTAFTPHRATAAAPPRPAPAPAASGTAPAPVRDGASLQSVLATAGAALFAVAAIVFTFFNPELADRAVRSTIIGLVTLAFLAGAWLLARRRLQSSAEAVGGLGLVFVGLDVQAVAGSFSDGTAAWVSAAIATAVAGCLLLAAALRFRIRIWLWTSLLALAAVPAMLGFAMQDALPTALLIAASAFAATGLMALLPRFAPGFPVRAVVPRPDGSADAGADPAPRRALLAETVALTALQAMATVLAIARIILAEPISVAVVLGVLAVAAVLASVRTVPRVWAFAAGVLAVGAGAVGASSVLGGVAVRSEWSTALEPAGAVLALLLCAIVPLSSRTPRIAVAFGAGLAAGVTSAPAVLPAVYIGSTLLAFTGRGLDETVSTPVVGDATWPIIVGLAVISLGFAVFARFARGRHDIRPLRGAALVVAALYATVAVLATAAGRVLPLAVSIAVLLVIAAGTAAVLIRRIGTDAASARVVLVVGVHVALLVSVLLAWQDRTVVPLAGIGTIAVLAVAAGTIAPAWRFLHLGLGYGYALALVSTALSLAGVGGVALLCLTASAGLLGAIAATFLPAVAARSWQTILVVASVPFAIGIAQVVFERSGWTALSTGLMFVLALSLLLTRRAGLTVVIRTLAAAVLVPSLAVVILCLGAQLLVQSGSPVVLPLIALLVALVLPSGGMIREGLVARGLLAPTADAARIAIEASALLTAVIAVALSLTREAAGFGTACLVLIIVGVGALLTSLVAGRRYGWWVAAASFTGALWSLWALNGVALPEAYLLPPALGAVLVALTLALRGTRSVALFAAGLAGAVAPVLALLIAADPVHTVPWRAYGLLAAGWLLLAAGWFIGRATGARLRRLRPLRTATVLIAAIAALAGTAQAVRWGSGTDPSPVIGGDAGVFLLALGMSALAAVALVAAARMLRSSASAPHPSRENALPADASETAARGESTSPREAPAVLDRLIASRWLAAPAALAFAIGVWPSIARDWFVIWGMWLLMIGWLVLMLRAAVTPKAQAANRGRATLLPPVWLLFGIAFITAVVAWSPRDLRVEMFSLPLGAFLLAAGALGLRRGADAVAVAGLDAWPNGRRGSWPLLAPGLIVMMSASIVSTFTDPLTWRAILVMGLALAAILLGAARRLAAPFIIGLIVLPVENVFVFSVQLGRGIESMPWWITLATVGAVLLIIAVAGERREGADRGVVARVRDLR
ncbi:hypothetical protein QF046_003183 [Microbacterium sp. W4I4]|uniref:SCO7613 C-terminal domain-containing membrane protein n=1 Tax=Microbacterium sp. W4I4 TaxID=3042295 RepID=UPI002786C4B8|nr:hypothetical protein [Microbacterium sp. W4I4]MDQ0615542.1 hypothetical protein [Microbacterium sp. W4I4]